MSFQRQFRRLPFHQQQSILQLFRQWTAWNARQATLLIYQLFWEHFLPKADTRTILEWLAMQTTLPAPALPFSLTQYLRRDHQIKGRVLRCDQPILVGTVISWERFHGYLRDSHSDEFDGITGINNFINNLDRNFHQLPKRLANLPFRKEKRLSWFFWDSPGYHELLKQPSFERQKDFYVKHLGLNSEDFALNKLLLFVFNLQDVINAEFCLHRPTIGDAACNLNFLPPPKTEKRYGMTVPSTSPRHSWAQNAGPIWGHHPERTRPEAVGKSDLLLLKHIIEFQILD